jgi:acyl-[acyl carrier protein]--UDP-N-acetylglucosamine O-acyltransferase
MASADSVAFAPAVAVTSGVEVGNGVGVSVGKAVRVGAGVSLGADVEVGSTAVMFPHAVINIGTNRQRYNDRFIGHSSLMKMLSVNFFLMAVPGDLPSSYCFFDPNTITIP